MIYMLAGVCLINLMHEFMKYPHILMPNICNCVPHTAIPIYLQVAITDGEIISVK